jgi:hypothetical protein
VNRKVVAACLLATAVAGVHAADYSFDLSEVERAPLEWSGFVDAKAEHFNLRPGSALYPLNFPGTLPRSELDRQSAGYELAGKYQRDTLTLYGRLAGTAAHDALVTSSNSTWLEAGLRLSPSTGLSFDAGKQLQRWGKGYAWNPVGFFERPKDPSDPTLSREGYVMASADWVKSLPGTLATVGFMPVLMPVNRDLNSDYGTPDKLNAGAKLYLLWADTDIDLLWAGEGSRPERIGLDFSRNLGSQLEIHGEWARTISATQRVVNPDGSIGTRSGHADSWLLGLRYLSEDEVTWILEFYRNGQGYAQDEFRSFYQLVSDAFAPTGTSAEQTLARSLAQSAYARPTAGSHYVYLRVSAKDPFDWLYVTPALSIIANTNDRSWQAAPELSYTGWQNVELRVRAILLHGDAGTEFGEKAIGRRLELLARLYF